ncbi:MAG: hypothetical protein ACP5IL_07160 [Syntrophobacteraceae bacterium]
MADVENGADGSRGKGEIDSGKPEVRLVREDATGADVPLERVEPGDLLRVDLAEKVPVDGSIIVGEEHCLRVDERRRADSGRVKGRRARHGRNG